MDWQALASIAAVVVTLGIFVKQSRRTQLAVQADMLVRLRQEFDSEQMRRRRARAAQGLLNGDASNPDLSDLLDFLGNIGGLVNLGSLNASTAYVYFGYWILGYWYTAEQHVSREREHYGTSWNTLEKAIKKKLEPARAKTEGDRWPPPDEQFLRREVAQAQSLASPPRAYVPWSAV